MPLFGVGAKVMLRKSLKTKFIIYVIPLIIFISLSLLFFFLNRANNLAESELAEVGFALAKTLSYSSELAVLSEDETFLEAPLRGIFEEEDVVSVTVYNREGRILASMKKTELEERIPKDVLEEILQRKIPLKRIDYTEQGEEVYNFFSPISMSRALVPGPEEEPPRMIGFTKVGLSLKSIETQVRSAFFTGLAIAFLMIFFGSSGVFFLVGKITEPIKILTEGAEDIGKGNLDYRIRIKTGDELEKLGKAFNQMAEDLTKSRTAIEKSKEVLEVKVKARTKELEELTQSLEEKVQERTKELQERIDELERFHKLTVGRELKMVELKKALQQAQEGIEKLKERRKGKPG